MHPQYRLAPWVLLTIFPLSMLTAAPSCQSSPTQKAGERKESSCTPEKTLDRSCPESVESKISRCPEDETDPCSIEIQKAKESRILLEDTKGLYLTDCEDHLKVKKDDLQKISGLQAAPSLSIPGSFDKLKAILNPIYLNKPLNLRVIKELKAAIHKYYVDEGYPFTVVQVPKQCISSGVLQLLVSQAMLSRIVMEGNDYAVHQDRIKNYILAKPCEPINANRVQRSLDFINRNPYRHVSAVYAAGQQPGTTDLIIPVEERKPWRIYIGADNTGPVRIRRQRLFTGLGVNDFLGMDSYWNFQYTTAYYPNTFQGYTGQWVFILPWRNILNFYGGYSTIHTPLIFPEMSNKGVFVQASGRYQIPTMLSQRVPFEIEFGFDFKRTNTSLFFSEVAFPNSTSAANLTQFAFNLRTGYNGDYARLEAVLELFYSPGELVGDETRADYNGLRPEASPQYIYGKAALRFSQWLPLDFEAVLCLRGQLSSAALLPSEQYGLGGYDTVRGYDEYQLSMDNAANINFELRTPGIQIISQIRKWKKKDSLQFLGFVDYGIGKNKEIFPGEHSPSWLLGIGPGARYTLDPNVAIRADWGWKMKLKPDGIDAIPYTGGKSMVQFSVTISY